MLIKVTIALIILAAGVACGIRIASQKLLWNDELFTQVETIDRRGYSDILKARFPEGNLSPLFYLGQKFVCRSADYRLPVKWRGEFCIYEPRGQVVLRILPVVCMSLAGALIFLYFACRFSIGIGLLSLAVTLSSFSFWAFMAEARPYALWFLLTALQGMFFLEIVERRSGERVWPWVLMSLVNVLLALTVFFSALPILATSLVLFVKERGKYVRFGFLGTLISLGVCALYHFIFKRTYSSLPGETAGILPILKGISAVFLSGTLVAKRDLILTNIPPFWAGFIVIGSAFVGERIKGLLAAFFLMLAMVLAAVIWFFGWNSEGNFVMAERHFIFLTPFAVFLVMAIVRSLWERSRDDAGYRLMVVISTGSMVLLSALWSYIHLLKWGPFWSV